MKINICYTNLNRHDTYTNISPFASPDSGFLQVDIRNLDEICSDDEVKEILAVDVINYLTADDTIKSIQNWIKKLKCGGRLILVFDDIYEIARRIYVQILNNEEINHIIYGKQEKPYEIKRSAFPMHWLKNHILAQNTRLIKCRLDNHQAILEVEKL